MDSIMSRMSRRFKNNTGQASSSRDNSMSKAETWNPQSKEVDGTTQDSTSARSRSIYDKETGGKRCTEEGEGSSLTGLVDDDEGSIGSLQQVALSPDLQRYREAVIAFDLAHATCQSGEGRASDPEGYEARWKARTAAAEKARAAEQALMKLWDHGTRVCHRKWCERFIRGWSKVEANVNPIKQVDPRTPRCATCFLPLRKDVKYWKKGGPGVL